MRIALVGPTHPFRGGIAQHTTLLADALGQRHEVLFISFRGQYPRWVFPGRTDRDPSMPPKGGPVEYALAPLRPWTWWQVARRVSAFRPAVTIVPWWVPFWAPSVGTVARILGSSDAKVLFLCHNVVPHEGVNRLIRRLCRFALAPGDAYLVHSATDENRLRELLPAASTGRAVVRRALLPDHAIAAPMERTRARELLGVATDDRVVLFFGFVRPYKGLEHLIRAVGLARTKLPRLRLMVAGEFWVSSDEYVRLAEEEGVSDRLTVDDRYVPNEEVAGYFCAADLVVLPYLEATQSGVVTLATRFGVPVVATRVGGLPEAVIDGVTGLLVPPGDPPAMAEALVNALGDGVFLDELRANVAADRERFGWSVLVDLIEEVIEELQVAGDLVGAGTRD